VLGLYYFYIFSSLFVVLCQGGVSVSESDRPSFSLVKGVIIALNSLWIPFQWCFLERWFSWALMHTLSDNKSVSSFLNSVPLLFFFSFFCGLSALHLRAFLILGNFEK